MLPLSPGRCRRVAGAFQAAPASTAQRNSRRRPSSLRIRLATAGAAKAEAAGDEKRAAKVRKELETKQAWLDQAQQGVAEFGGEA